MKGKDRVIDVLKTLLAGELAGQLRLQRNVAHGLHDVPYAGYRWETVTLKLYCQPENDD
ncbi:hypothetical protein [Thiothrix nivea]|uniref:Uncharacterized protein n=1 Tax=Thiothrix nivea (strain ATCC 35100 / DSM 5205 / JP2) TaxID=870187 RepID=A0A656HDT5_THINJ|nr:hypothetical protein [Thiothrix nivea]EIJ33616.1 hypothetical protein Thini_0991 [Thiothrix nivea DSM 5205]